MIDGKKFFDQPTKNDKIAYEKIRKVATGQGDDYTTGCLLEYTYFKDYYKIIAIDLSKQQALDADRKAIQTQEIQESISFLKKQKKLFWTFHKELQKFCK